jgi:hypothetical protein
MSRLSSGRPKNQTRVLDEFSKKEVTQDTYLSGYREIDGRKLFLAS